MAGLGQGVEAANIVGELLDLIDPEAFTDPRNVSLLDVCRWLADRSPAYDLDQAKICLAELKRLQQLVKTLETEAALNEGQGVVALAEAQIEQAAAYFQQAAAGWQALGRPYDQAQALNDLGQMLGRVDILDFMSFRRACEEKSAQTIVCNRTFRGISRQKM